MPEWVALDKLALRIFIAAETGRCLSSGIDQVLPKVYRP
jgi:hypothetical protein